MDLQEFEDVIIARLTEVFAGTDVQVSHFPDTQAEHDDGINAPIVWVVFKESKFAQPYEQDPRYFNTIGTTAQDSTLYFEVFYKARKRRGVNGLFDMRTKVLNSLNGWRTPRADKMFPITDTNLSLVETIWNWTTIFGVKFISVPCEDEVEPFGILQKGTYLNDEVGDLVVENPETTP